MDDYLKDMIEKAKRQKAGGGEKPSLEKEGIPPKKEPTEEAAEEKHLSDEELEKAEARGEKDNCKTNACWD